MQKQKTQVSISIVLRNEGGTTVNPAEFTVNLPRRISDENLSPRADKALRAALKTLGVKLPKVKTPYSK